MGKYRLQIHIAKPGPFPASALNVRRNGEKRFLILADGDQAISELRRSIQEQYARLYENEPDFTAVQLTNKDCYELDDNYKIRDVFDSLDTVRVVGHQEAQQIPKPTTQNLLKRKVEKGPVPSHADSRSTSSTPAPEAGSIDGESKKQRKKRRKAEEAAAKATAAVASSGLFANGAIIDHYEDSIPEGNDTFSSSDPSDSTTTISTVLDGGRRKAVVEKEAIIKDHKAEQEKAAEEKARPQKEAEELARKEVEEKKRKTEEVKRQKQEEKARKEAEDMAKKEAEAKARKEAEAKARKEAEAKARKEAEDKARKEAEDKARKEAEDKARREAEEKAKKEAEDEARKEAEEKAKELAAEEEKKRKQEEKERREADKAKAAEEKARKAAEAKEAKEAKRKAAEETKARLAEEKARKAAELKEAKRVAAEEKKQKLAEEKALRVQSKESDTRRASQSEHPTESDSEVDQLLSSPEPTDVASLEAAFGTPESSTASETPIADQVHNEDSESGIAMPEPDERPRHKSTVVVEISARTAPNTGGIVNRLAPGLLPGFLTSAEEGEASKETLTVKAVSDESSFTTATEHPLSPKKRGRPPKVKPEATMHMSPVTTTGKPSTTTQVLESKAPLADLASDPESEQELEVFSFFEKQRLKGQQPPPVINTPKPAPSVFSFEPYHSTPPQRLTDKPTMASDSDSDSDASEPDYDAPPSMPPMIISSRPSISVARLRPESPRGLAISMPKVSPSKRISNVDYRKEEVSDSAEDAYDNGALTEEEEDDEPLIRTRKVVLPGVPNPMALVKEEAKENEDDDTATKDERDELQETSDESDQSEHRNSSDDDSTSSDSESESDSDSESDERGPGSGSRSSEDQEAVLVKTEPPTNGSRGGGGILSGLLSLQGASHGSSNHSNHNNDKPAGPARTSFFSLTDISAKMGLPVTSLAELTAQGRAKKIGSIGSAIASPASSASSSRKAMGGMNDKGARSSEDESSDDDEAESDSDDNTDSSDEEGDFANKARAGPQIKIAGKKRRSSTKSAGGGSSGRKKGRLDALF